MPSTTIIRIFAFLYSIGCVLCLVQHGYMTHYYYNHKPIFVNESMVLELTNKFLGEEPGERFLTCDVNIVTSASRKLMIHFLSLEISYEDKDIDRLHIYDYKESGRAVRITPPQGLYGVSDAYITARGGAPAGGGAQADYVSSGNRLKLDYQGKPTLAYNGFKILITSFRDARGDCGRGYLRCQRKHVCIPAATWCDGNPNCGVTDDSDEATCNTGPLSTWNPWGIRPDDNQTVESTTRYVDIDAVQTPRNDGQVTAVVAASLSCLMFFITAALLACVVMKLNKRDIINQNNITIEFKKKRTTKRQASNKGDYAPPAYEVVIAMNEDPPPYQLVAPPDDADDTGSETSSEAEGACGGDHEYSTIVETDRVNKNRNNPQSEPDNVNNICVTCDIHGDIVDSSKLVKQNGTQPNGMALTKYRLCSQGPESKDVQRQDSRRGRSDSFEIEVLHSDSEAELEDGGKNKAKVCNGKAKTNGVHHNGSCKGSKLNGHASVSFNANSKIDGDNAIEIVSNET